MFMSKYVNNMFMSKHVNNMLSRYLHVLTWTCYYECCKVDIYMFWHEHDIYMFWHEHDIYMFWHEHVIICAVKLITCSCQNM
jgi:hypothetical protein